LMKIINRFVQAMLPGPNGEIQSLVQSTFVMNRDVWISQDADSVFLRLIRVCERAHEVVAKKYANTSVDVNARPSAACTLCANTSHRKRDCPLLDSEELRSVWGDIVSPSVVSGADGDDGGEIQGSPATKGNADRPFGNQRSGSPGHVAEEHSRPARTGERAESALPEPKGRQTVRELQELVAEQNILLQRLLATGPQQSGRHDELIGVADPMGGDRKQTKESMTTIINSLPPTDPCRTPIILPGKQGDSRRRRRRRRNRRAASKSALGLRALRPMPVCPPTKHTSIPRSSSTGRSGVNSRSSGVDRTDGTVSVPEGDIGLSGGPMPPTQLGWAETSAKHHSRKRHMSSCGMPPEPKQRHTPGGAIPSGRSPHDPAAREDIPDRVDQPQNAERHPQATGSNDLAHGDESYEDSPQRGSFAESGQFSGGDFPQDADRVLEQTNGAPSDTSDEGVPLDDDGIEVSHPEPVQEGCSEPAVSCTPPALTHTHVSSSPENETVDDTDRETRSSDQIFACDENLILRESMRLSDGCCAGKAQHQE
jgi:hypothetical protein